MSDELVARVAELEDQLGQALSAVDTYTRLRDHGWHENSATVDTIVSAFLTVELEESVREGWHRAACSLCDWYATGGEDTCDIAQYEHAAMHVDQLRTAGWMPIGECMAP